MQTLSPVLLLESVEDALPFWIERLGFEELARVPDDPSKDAAGQPVGFVMLRNGAVQVMLQSRASVANDAPELATGAFSCSGVGLFIEVDDLDDYLPRLDGVEIVVEERTTFYGMREIGVRAPGGCLVMLAQKVDT